MSWKKCVRVLLFPHPAVTALLSAAALTGMLLSMLHLGMASPVTIAFDALSFYALVLVCLRIPDIIRGVRRFRQENRWYLRYRNDVQWRINLSLTGGCTLNAAYALFQLGLGLWHRSAWFYAMAGYYLLLALMRLTLVRHTRRHAAGENRALAWKKYRFCGWMLLVMNLALTVFTLYFVYRIRTFRHHEVTTIAMAVYTFTALTLAIVNVIRYRKHGSPAYSAAKAISLASASVSMLVLENAMLTTFGEAGDPFRRLLLSLSGAAVILLVHGIALYMIINAGRKLRQPDS